MPSRPDSLRTIGTDSKDSLSLTFLPRPFLEQLWYGRALPPQPAPQFGHTVGPPHDKPGLGRYLRDALRVSITLGPLFALARVR
jgi:hypothetical protein